MIDRTEIKDIVNRYEPEKFHVTIFGSHSALELGMSAKAHKVPTVLIAQEGRDEIYTRNSHLYDKIITVENFRDILNEEIQSELIDLNSVLVPNRSFSVYVKSEEKPRYDEIENDFKVPVYGQRGILRAEDRNDEHSQYELLKKSGVKIPKEFKKPSDIDRLSIVKVQQAGNDLERAFFYAKDETTYNDEAELLLKEGLIDEKGLNEARIEEFVLGPRFNANFHFYGLRDVFNDYDFVGCSDRRQVNLQGFLNLTADVQMKLKELGVPVLNEEIGHYGVTIRESKQELLYNVAEKLFNSDYIKEMYPLGLIGPCGIQGAIRYNPEVFPEKKELEFVVFDLSPRVPGDPAIGPTSPEMRNLSLKYNEKIEDPLDLIVMELDYARRNNKLAEVVT